VLMMLQAGDQRQGTEQREMMQTYSTRSFQVASAELDTDVGAGGAGIADVDADAPGRIATGAKPVGGPIALGAGLKEALGVRGVVGGSVGGADAGIAGELVADTERASGAGTARARRGSADAVAFVIDIGVGVAGVVGVAGTASETEDTD
jgi:hypothetical protein